MKINSNSSLENISLGGVDQWILIRGNNIDNPILLSIHGGPGGSSMSHHNVYNKALEEKFIFVSWDQRGAGKSYSKNIPKESMTIKQIVSDAHELVQLLKKRFNRNKIFLMGHSWGTALGMYLVKQYPEDFYAYIGIAQWSNGKESERLSYQFTYNKAKDLGNTKALRALEEIGSPVNGLYKNFIKELLVQKKWVLRFNGEFYAQTNHNEYIKNILFSNVYSFYEKYNYLKGLFFSLNTLWKEFVDVDFTKEITQVEIPVIFIAGKYDYFVPSDLGLEYYKMLKTPKKEMIWFNRSGHFPHFEEADKFNALIISLLNHNKIFPFKTSF